MFSCASLFQCFCIILGVFLDAFGVLLAPFRSLCRLFGVLVSFCWVPSACLGCLWALSAFFCGAFGSSGVSVDSLCHFWANLGATFLKCSCDVFPFRNFKRASRSHAKTGFFGGLKQSSHAGKTHFFTKTQFS